MDSDSKAQGTNNQTSCSSGKLVRRYILSFYAWAIPKRHYKNIIGLESKFYLHRSGYNQEVDEPI